jgi:hypothetical protein
MIYIQAELDHLTEESPATSAVRKPVQSFDDHEASEKGDKFPQQAAAGGGAPSTDSNISGPNLIKILEERLKAYQQGEAAAKQAGEAAKCRRCQRGIQVITFFCY